MPNAVIDGGISGATAQSATAHNHGHLTAAETQYMIKNLSYFAHDPQRAAAFKERWLSVCAERREEENAAAQSNAQSATEETTQIGVGKTDQALCGGIVTQGTPNATSNDNDDAKNTNDDDDDDKDEPQDNTNAHPDADDAEKEDKGVSKQGQHFASQLPVNPMTLNRTLTHNRQTEEHTNKKRRKGIPRSCKNNDQRSEQRAIKRYKLKNARKGGSRLVQHCGGGVRGEKTSEHA